MKQSFLSQVAAYYAPLKGLHKFAFVLPNSRSAQQLEHIIADSAKGAMLLPQFMSMNQFVDHIMRHSNLVTVNPIEALFLAFQAYKKQMGDQASDFDKFAFWGQIIVNDFNEIDMSLADAQSIYKELNDEKELASNYIDSELAAVISRYFNVESRTSGDGMWKDKSIDRNKSDNSVQGKSNTLWNSLGDIYDDYSSMLHERQLTTQGKLYRNAVDVLKEMRIEDLGFERIVIVGHDMLTVSELSIFKTLKNKATGTQAVEFWWDNASPAFDKRYGNPATKMIELLATTFPSPVAIEPLNGFPHITVHNVPSIVGQAKCAFEGINVLSYDTAIILPDDSLLQPLLYSLPDHLMDNNREPNPINVTLGYQLRNSSIATLMHLVTRAHRNATYKNEEWIFYREDVRDILSHPIIKMAFTADVLHINNEIEASSEFNISAHMFDGSPLQQLFTSFKTSMNQAALVQEFLTQLKKFCTIVMQRIKPRKTNGESSGDDHMPLQCAFLQQYMNVLDNLSRAITTIGLPVDDTTVFHLIDRLSTGSIVPFGGTSNKGLQVMGMRESRCLDFNDLRILSVNEGVLPKRNNIQSLIPDRYRRAFNLPTAAMADISECYNFYRLISRAESVSLFFDSSDDSNCEPSRFIEQLDKVYGCPIEYIKRTATVSNAPELKIKINDPALAEEITRKYTTGDPKSKRTACLSASSINEYINCPLNFYFHHVEQLNNDNDLSDFMDYSTFGTIVHDTLQQCYDPKVAGTSKLTADYLRDFKKKELVNVLRQRINDSFMHLPEEQWNLPITGQAFILNETLQAFVSGAIDHDIALIKEHGPIKVLECEKDHLIKLDLNGTEVNFTFKADRVDIVGSKLRIIDYKTGGDPTIYQKLDELFDASKGAKRPKAILQLLLYTVAYCQDCMDTINKENIQCITPVIYKLRNMGETGAYIKTGQRTKDELIFDIKTISSNELLNNFKEKLSKTVNDILRANFAQQNLSDYHCSHCRFTDFCRR